MAGHLLPAPMRPEQEQALAGTPADELPALPFVTGGGLGPAKYGNRLRVQAASIT